MFVLYQTVAVRDVGTAGTVALLPATRRHPQVLRQQDRHLLRLARLLHEDARASSSGWRRRGRLRPRHLQQFHTGQRGAYKDNNAYYPHYWRILIFRFVSRQ